MSKFLMDIIKVNTGKKLFRYVLLLPAFFSLVSCSAYFNTLYNAKTAFNEALVLHNKSAKKYPDSLLVTAPSEAITKYERTIEKTIKVKDGFPKKKKYHDDALILMGKSYYYKKDFQKAIRRLRELQMEFQTSPFIPESYIFLGRCYIEEGNFDKAEEALEIVLKKYPEFDKNQQVTMLLVEIAIRREGRSDAIGLLEKAMKSGVSDQKRFEIIYRISKLYIDMKQYQKAIPLLLSVQRKKDFPEHSYKLDDCLLECYIETDKLSDALNLVSIMASSRLYQTHNEEILFKKGLILKKLGKYDNAIEVFKLICKDKISDSTAVTTDTTNIKGKAYYQLGLLYQLKKKSYKDAMNYFQLAAKSTDTSVSIPASKRLTAMKRLDTLRHNINNSSENVADRGNRIVLIGEIFKYDLDEPDSAYYEFIKLTNDSVLNKDSSLLAKALCAAAVTAKIDLKDSIHSDSLFKLIIKKFPSSEYAKQAQKFLNIAVTVKTRQDSALNAYKLAEEQFYINNDVKGAIRSFYSIYKNYPDLDVAPKSLYAAAWFTDNVLNKKTTAKSLYEKICEKYQKTIYCANAAEPRIKIVKDTLAALDALRKKTESQKKIKKAVDQNEKKKNENSTSTDSLQNANSESQENELFSKEELNDSVPNAKDLEQMKPETNEDSLSEPAK